MFISRQRFRTGFDVLIRLCAFSYAFVASAACLPHCVHLRIRFSWFTGDTLASACSGSVISVVLVPYRRCSVANVRAFSLQRLVGSERCLRAALRHSETSYNDVRTMRIHKAMTVMCSYCSSSGFSVGRRRLPQTNREYNRFSGPLLSSRSERCAASELCIFVLRWIVRGWCSGC